MNSFKNHKLMFCYNDRKIDIVYEIIKSKLYLMFENVSSFFFCFMELVFYTLLTFYTNIDEFIR